MMTKAQVMRAANAIIYYLMVCDDEEFLDRTLNAIASGDFFMDDEIGVAEWEAQAND